MIAFKLTIINTTQFFKPLSSTSVKIFLLQTFNSAIKIIANKAQYLKHNNRFKYLLLKYLYLTADRIRGPVWNNSFVLNIFGSETRHFYINLKLISHRKAITYLYYSVLMIFHFFSIGTSSTAGSDSRNFGNCSQGAARSNFLKKRTTQD
jgi:hypothetical protein